MNHETNPTMEQITEDQITNDEIGMLLSGSIKSQEDVLAMATKAQSDMLTNSVKLQSDILTTFTQKLDAFFAERLKEQVDTNTALVEQNKQLAQQNQELINQNKKMYKNLANKLNRVAKAVDKQTEANAKAAEEYSTLVHRLDERFIEVPNSGTTAKWKNDAWAAARQIAVKIGKPTQAIWGQAYKKMKDNYNVDVDVLFAARKDPVRDATRLKMCMNNEQLAATLEKALVDMWNEANEEGAASPQPSPQGAAANVANNQKPRKANVYKGEWYNALHIPADIRNTCKELYPNFSDIQAFRKVFRKMKDISALDINEYIERNRSLIKYKYFTHSYFISKDAVLKALFDRAVEELRKEREV